MNEVRVFAVLLAGLLVAAYMSWTHKEEAADTTAVTLWDIRPAALERIELVTTTQTVAFSWQGEQRYGWFEVQKAKSRRVFVASDKVEKLTDLFAPLTALRSLGRVLSPEDLERAGLTKPKRKLTIAAAGKTRVFDVGTRTNGARDHYVRPQSGQDVYLLASKSLGDLEFPESRYMQRQVLVKPLAEVAGAVLAANGKTITVAHRNHADRKNAFWAIEGEEQPNEQIGNFMVKLGRLLVKTYPEDLTEFEQAEPILEVSWRDDDGEPIGTTSLYKRGAGDKTKFFVRSDRTIRPGEVSKLNANRLEKDIPTVLP